MVSCWSFISLRWCKGIFAIDNWNHDKFEGKPPWRVSGLDFPKETNPLNQSASECAEESLFHVPYARIKDDKTKYICHRTTSISRLFCSIFFRMAVQPRGWGKPQQVSAYSLKASSVVCYGLLNDTRVCLKIESTYENYTKLSCFPLNVPFGGIPVYPIIEQIHMSGFHWQPHLKPSWQVAMCSGRTSRKRMRSLRSAEQWKKTSISLDGQPQLPFGTILWSKN